MRRIMAVVVAGACLLASQASAQLFYATNNLSAANFGTGGDELIVYDFGTAAWVSVGTVNVAGNPVVGGIGGLDWAGGVGNGPLIGAVSFGGAGNGIYAISPTDASAAFLGNSPASLQDLAYNPANGKMYGTDAADGLWRDDNGDSIPETFLGVYGLGTLTTGLGFDGAGNVWIHDIALDIIYKGVGDAPGSVAPTIAIGYNSNFSQGLYVGANKGYHGALNATSFQSENYSFNLDGTGYALQSVFPVHVPNGLPQVEVGDLTPIPEPATLSLLALLGLAAIRRR